MKTKRSIRYVLLVLLWGVLATALAACSDNFLTEDPPHIIVPDNLYTDAAGFEAGINALYRQVREERDGTSGRNNIRQMIFTIGTDNGFANHISAEEGVFNKWGPKNTSQKPFYLDIWSWLYQTVNAANTIIQRADNPAVNWTEEEKNRVLAEARLIRAWAYRHLTTLWGDVPLNLDASSGENIRVDWTRAPKEEVWKQMEEDWLFAEEHLPEETPEMARATKMVARHYLAELYLTLGEPARAETYAREVIDSGLFSLITERYGVEAGEPGAPFMDQFIGGNTNRSEGNTEVLWSFQLENDVTGGGGNIMRRYWVNRYRSLKGLKVTEAYGGRGNGRLSTTRWALELYEPQDDRGSKYAVRWYYLYNDPGNLPEGVSVGDTLWTVADEEEYFQADWPSTRKWDWVDPDNVNVGNAYKDQPYLRLAETYLLLAEALYKQGKLAGAAEALNVLRRRAGASEITPDQVDLDFILDERSRELLTEEDRRHTLIRTGTWLERVREHNPAAAPNVTERDIYFPIPQAVIDANIGTQMQQNPGY